MTKKAKKPKQQLINSLLDDLKDQSNEESLRIGPNGIEASGEFSAEDLKLDLGEEENDKTTVLGQESSSSDSDEDENSIQIGAEFYVEDNKTTPFKSAARNMDSIQPPKLDGLEDAMPAVVPPIEDESELTVPLQKSEPETRQTKPTRTHHQQQEVRVSAPVSTPAPQAAPPRSAAFDNQFSRAENLKVAQQRILELEKDIEKYRKENEMLTSASEISRNRIDELISKSLHLEKQKNELKELNESELRIFKDGLIAKDTEIHRLRSKVEELESRLANDLRKVRVRERELENRLELAKVERTALLRAKDETILDLKRKTENLQAELESYQNKVIELGQKIDANQDQFARTVRALRLALTNLEVNEGTSTSITLTPIKKAD